MVSVSYLDESSEDTYGDTVDENMKGKNKGTNEENIDSENTRLKEGSNEEDFDDVESDSEVKSLGKILPETGEQKFILTSLIRTMIVLGMIVRTRKRL